MGFFQFLTSGSSTPEADDWIVVGQTMVRRGQDNSEICGTESMHSEFLTLSDFEDDEINEVDSMFDNAIVPPPMKKTHALRVVKSVYSLGQFSAVIGKLDLEIMVPQDLRIIEQHAGEQTLMLTESGGQGILCMDLQTGESFALNQSVSLSSVYGFTAVVDSFSGVFSCKNGIFGIDTFSGESICLMSASADHNGYEDGLMAEALFDRPLGLDSDAKGNVYICDAQNHAIRMIANNKLVVTTVAGDGKPGNSDGLPHQARFFTPRNIRVDNQQQCLFVTDMQNKSVRRVSLETGLVTTVRLQVQDSRSGEWTLLRMGEPNGLCILDKHVVVVDSVLKNLVIFPRFGGQLEVGSVRECPRHARLLPLPKECYPTHVCEFPGDQNKLLVTDWMTNSVLVVDIC